MAVSHFFAQEPYKIGRVLRYFGYSIVSIIFTIATITEPNISYYSLLVLPFIWLVLLWENQFLHRIEYYYGKSVRQNAIFLIDVFLNSLFIAAFHVLLFPSFILFFTLIFIGIFTRVSLLTFMMSPVVAIVTFYVSSLLFFGFKPYLENSSMELNFILLVFFMVYMSLGMYAQKFRLEQMTHDRQHFSDELNRYLKLNNQLAKYAPVQLWQSIMRGEVQAKVEYQRRKLTIFFSDIQGFTDLSETLIPDDLAFLLNDYLKHMTEIAKHYGGTIDKFMGDGILIFFGDPTSRGEQEDAIACLDMAVAMRQQMRILRERWIKMGYSSLHIRMGIATGYCHVGNYGSAHRLSYTIVGRDANLAARLQGAAEVDEILISEETFNLVKENFLCIKHIPLKLKGITDFVSCWQVVERYHESVEKYRRWYDYEYKGFNLLLNLDKTPIYEYPQLIEVMQQTIDRIKLQQSKTDEDGAVLLSEKRIIKINKDVDPS